MKKLAVVLLAAFALGGLGSAVSADPVCTGTGVGLDGCITVAEGGYLVAADGDAANPDPTDGYISVSDAGQVCADDNGSPGASESPTCAP